MAGLIILAAGLVLLSGYMGWNRRCLKRDIYFFTGQLEKALDDMIQGKDIGTPEETGDVLWSRIHGKLERLNHIWRRKNTESLEEKEEMKALISDISHQTKTPIANLKIYLEMMQAEEDISERDAEFMQKMQKQTEKLDFLLQSMVKMSRLETGIIEIHKQSVNLYETLGHVVAAIVPKAEQKQIALYVECQEDIPVPHDEKWTEEAIFNLLDNAVKYTDAGGRICIFVTPQEIFTKISIKDTGKGIALERQAEIFTRFYREPEICQQEGVGVGLYLARKIITLQGGYVTVDSQVGKGAEFQIYLPNE